MRISAYYLVILACIFTTAAYGANATSSGINITGYSTIIVKTSVIIPDYNNSYVNFVVYPLSNTSSLTTLKLLNQSSFTKYNMSVSILNSTGYPPFAGEIVVFPTTYTPSNTYQIQLRAVGGTPSNYTQIVNVTILNSTVYNEYVRLERSSNSIRNGSSATSVSTVSTVPVTQQTTAVQNVTSSAQTTAYFNVTTAATTAVSTGQQGSTSLIYAAIAIVLIILIAAYFLMKGRSRR